MTVKVKLKIGRKNRNKLSCLLFKGDDLHYLDEESNHKVIKDVDK